MRFSLCVLSLLTVTALAGAASAAPGLLPLQGYLTDTAGDPIDGTRTVLFTLYESETADDEVWSEAQDVDVVDGHFLVYLGSESVLELALFRDHEGLYLGLTVEEDSEMERIPLGTAAYAGFAQYCGDARTVEGLTIDDLSVGAGDGLVLDAGALALDTAGCAAGYVLKRSPENDGWECVPDEVGDGETVEIGDGLVRDDATGAVAVDMALIADLAIGVCYDTEAELAAVLDGDYLPADYVPSWGELSDIPSDFADGVDDGTVFTVGAGLAMDGDELGLDVADCAAGYILKRNAGNDDWECAPDDVGTAEPFELGAGLVREDATGAVAVDPAVIEGLATAVCFDSTAELVSALFGEYLPADYVPMWAQISGIPSGFADGVDDDTTYTVGAGLTLDADQIALDATGCAAGYVLKRNVENDGWECVADEVGGEDPLTIGAGLVRDDATGAVELDQALVESLATGVCYDSGAELVTALAGEYLPAGYTPAWGDLTGIPSGFADGVDDDTTYTVGDGLAMSSDQISVNAVGCSAGHVLKRSAANDRWECAPDELGAGTTIELGTGLVRDGATGAVELDSAVVESLATGVCYDSAEELQSALVGEYMPAAYTPAWGELSGIPSGFADGVDDGTVYTVGEGLALSGDELSLTPPTTTTLGGVIAKTCAAGDKVTGIAADGTVLCGADLTGGAPAVVAPGEFSADPVASGSDNLSRLQVDDTHVFAIQGTRDGKIVSAPKTGGLMTELTAAQPWPTDIAIDDTHVYWSDRQAPGALKRVPKAGGTVEQLAVLGSGKSAYGLAVADGVIYWATDDGVVSLRTWGGATTPVPGAPYSASYVQVSGEELFFSKSTGYYALPLAGGLPRQLYHRGSTRPAHDAAAVYVDYEGHVLRIPKTGSRMTPLAVFPFGRGEVLENGGRLYWVGEVLATVSTDGSGTFTVITLVGGGSPTADATHLYWANETTVYRGAFPW